MSETEDRPTLQKALGHLTTINRHKLQVMRNCFAVGLYKQGLLHDLSKYSPEEFMTGARFYQGTRSPNTAEREKTGMCRAWLHHKGRNKHHYEYWIDIVGRGNPTEEGKPMPTRYVVEMFCDRVAACMVYEGEAYTSESALRYFMRTQGRMTMHPDTEALLWGMLEYLAEHGEEQAFAAIREHIVKARFTYGEHGTFS